MSFSILCRILLILKLFYFISASNYECPSGWTKYGEKCLYVSTQQKSWDDSYEFCKGEQPNGTLVEIFSKEENDAVSGLVRNSNLEYWIGLRTRVMHFRRFLEWKDSEINLRGLFNNFPNGQIDRHFYSKKCGFLDDNGVWYLTESCNLQKRFLCQKSLDCRRGYYGRNCTERCHCYKTPCNRQTGKCPYGCEDGWMGEKCDKVKESASVSVHCMKESHTEKTALIRIDKKGVEYDEINILDENDEIVCNKSVFTSDYDGVLNLKITIYPNGTSTSNCLPYHTSDRKFLWNIRTEEVAGFLSKYDKKFDVQCDFSKAEKMSINRTQFIDTWESSVTLQKTEVTQSTENVQLILQDPVTQKAFEEIPIGSKVQIAILLNTTTTRIAPKGVSPYNCSCSTSDGAITRMLTDSHGCPVKNSPITNLSPQSSNTHLLSNVFDAFTLYGRTDILFKCKFHFCFDVNLLDQCVNTC